MGNAKILFELIVKSLSTDVDADAQCKTDVNDIFFHGGVKDPQVPLARLFDWVILLVGRGHDLV